VRELASPPQPSLAEIQSKLPEFLGEIQQRPPAYSALKVNGQRAYKLAREGQQFQLEPRPVEIYELSITGYEYPELKINLRCGSGTYVRSLGRDLAESLGTAAVMSALNRTAIGEFRCTEGLDADRLTEAQIATHLQPASIAVGHLPRVTLSPDQLVEIRHGRQVATTSDFHAAPEIAALDEAGNLVAILREKTSGMLGPGACAQFSFRAVREIITVLLTVEVFAPFANFARSIPLPARLPRLTQPTSWQQWQPCGEAHALGNRREGLNPRVIQNPPLAPP